MSKELGQISIQSMNPARRQSLRRFLATSDHWTAGLARVLRRQVRDFTLPAPRSLVRPCLLLYVVLRALYLFLARTLVCEPLFKAYCQSYGSGLRTDAYVHWIQGNGSIVLGDYVKFDGKSSITFAARFSDNPTLRVGNCTTIGHGASLAIGKEIRIGNNCRIASGVLMFDSSGHAADPQLRLQGAPPAEVDVRPITIHDNVWIGKRVIIFPGVSIGEGSIVSAGSVVMTDVAPYTVVAGNPARRIGSLDRPIHGELTPELSTTV
jgi:acetyltransferase-like isoleucine patch superfamily enzyme